MNRFLSLCVAVVMLVSSATTAVAFEGRWYSENNPNGAEILQLWDASDGSYLDLRGEIGFCGVPGASYERIRRVLRNNGPSYEPVYWRIADECGRYVRICVENWYNENACSTYYSRGWKWDD